MSRLLLPLVIVLVVIGGVVGLRQYKKVQSQKADINFLNNYFSASTKHGNFVISANYPTEGGQRPDQDAEFWVKDKQIRIDISGDDKREIVTKDNVTYLCGRPPFAAGNVCTVAVIPVETYLLGFSKPSNNVSNLGLDRADNCTKYQYAVKNTFRIPDAPNSYYVEDTNYCVSAGQSLIYTGYRGYIPEKDGTITDVNQMENVIYKFKKIETNVEIPDSTFVLPFPIQKS